MTVSLDQPGRVDSRALARAGGRFGATAARLIYSNPVHRSTRWLRWIKQHLRIKHLPGKREDAAKTHGARGVTTCRLIAIVRKEFQFEAPLCACLEISSLSVSAKTQLSYPFPGDESTTQGIGDAEQRILFNLWPLGCDFLPFACPGQL